MINPMFDVESPFSGILTAVERIGEVVSLTPHLHTPVPGAQSYQVAMRVHSVTTCALRVHRKIKTGPNVYNWAIDECTRLPLVPR